MRSVITRRSAARLGAGALSLAAIGALLIGCTGGGEPTGGDADDAPAAEEGTSDPGNGAEPRADGLPGDWTGTVSAEQMPETDGVSYFVLQNLYTQLEDRGTITAEEIEATEFISGGPCEGEASINGGAATCTVNEQDGMGGTTGVQLKVTVRLVPAGFGNSALLMYADADGPTDFTVPADVELGFGRVQTPIPGEVSAQEVAEQLVESVHFAQKGDGPRDPDMTATCEMGEGGITATCQLTGAPDGGNGTWHAIAQRGAKSDPSDGQWYLFSKVPA